MLRAYVRGLALKRGWAEGELLLPAAERVLFVADETRLARAKAAMPGLVPYLIEELDMMSGFGPESLGKVHLVKKILGGRVREVRPRLSTV